MFDLKPRLSRDGIAEATPRGWLLSIPAGSRLQYRLAQVDDHLRIPRRDYPWRAPVTMQLEARVSAATLPGTWGFGFWNDPYGFSFGPGNGFLRLPALPNAGWFFFSSPSNYLSFRDNTPGNGFLAQVFASPRFHRALPLAAAALPLFRKAARRLLSKIIPEDSARVTADVTEWHHYRIEWLTDRTRLLVDGISNLETTLSPRGPLGIVIWIDNQYAAFRPDGKLNWGMEESREPAWLEIRDLKVKTQKE